MNPFQHGEVFVTDDGAETDLDVGHYERFLDLDRPGKAANVTTGQIYSTVIAQGARGVKYLGDTVQVIPHITNEIKRRMRAPATRTEDGPRPTWSSPRSVAPSATSSRCRSWRRPARCVTRSAARTCFFLHVSLLPYLGAVGELKTKPTQHSVAALRSIGIQPDAIVCRSDRPVSDKPTGASSRSCATSTDGSRRRRARRAEHLRHPDGAARPRPRRLRRTTSWGSPSGDVNWGGWASCSKPVHHPKHDGHRRPSVGKYVDLPGCLPLGHRGGAGRRVRPPSPRRTSGGFPLTSARRPRGAAPHLSDLDGIVVPGGFGVRGIEGKLGALKFARENGIPALGLCLGLQCMVIEYARDVAGLTGASSSEFDPDAAYPVIATMAEQVDILAEGDMGGTMRLGLYPAELLPGSLASEVYGATRASERHRHRYEVNNAYRAQLGDASIVFSGLSPDRNLVEYVELPRASASRTASARRLTRSCARGRTKPHPLFRGLIGAALERQQASRLFEVPVPETVLVEEPGETVDVASA